ncbi:hypothetical protein G3576_30730, partial [Roseomonas stagni]
MRIITGAPGTRKTTIELERMVREPGCYLFANPTVDLITERVADLQRMADEAGTKPVIIAIHRKTRDTVVRQVTRTIADLPRDMENVSHVIALVTHEGIISADLSRFSGWHVIVDEVPASIATGSMRIPATSAYMLAAYDLADQGDGWGKVVVHSEAPGFAKLQADDFLAVLATFHRRAQSNAGVYVNLTDWRDAQVTGREVNWVSVWTLHELEQAPFESVTLIGSGIMHSLTYLVSNVIAPLNITQTQMSMVRAGSPRVVIEYFARAHRGSTLWWSTDLGEQNLVAIRRYLETRQVGYWSANNDVAPFLSGLPNRMKPKIAGSNRLLDRTSCAIIYSSKALPTDRLLTDAFGITRDQIERARECEDIWQFIWRGALRTPDFTGEYRIWLHDRAQAEALAEQLRQSGMTTDIVLQHVALPGFHDVVRQVTPGRPPIYVGTAAEIDAAKKLANAKAARQYRARARAAKAAATKQAILSNSPRQE